MKKIVFGMTAKDIGSLPEDFQAGIEEIMDIFLSETETPGQTAIRHILESALQRKKPPAKDWEFLIHALAKIYNGENPKKSLQIEKRKGNKKHDPLLKHALISLSVIQLIAQGKTQPKAVKQTAINFHTSEGTVERYYSLYRNVAEVLAIYNPNLNLCDPQSIKELRSAMNKPLYPLSPIETKILKAAHSQ